MSEPPGEEDAAKGISKERNRGEKNVRNIALKLVGSSDEVKDVLQHLNYEIHCTCVMKK